MTNDRLFFTGWPHPFGVRHDKQATSAPLPLTPYQTALAMQQPPQAGIQEKQPYSITQVARLQTKKMVSVEIATIGLDSHNAGSPGQARGRRLGS